MNLNHAHTRSVKKTQSTQTMRLNTCEVSKEVHGWVGGHLVNPCHLNSTVANPNEWPINRVVVLVQQSSFHQGVKYNIAH